MHKLFTFAISCIIAICTADSVKTAEDAENSTARKWLKAVKNSDMPSALSLAAKLTKNSAKINESRSSSDKTEFYLIDNRFCIAYTYLENPDFDAYDFKLWEDALFFKSIANEIYKDVPSGGSPIQAAFNAVRKKIHPKALKKGIIPWPRNVWNNGSGLCDRQAWVLCEIVAQMGYQCSIVYLQNPQTKVSPHTICEIRKGKQTWTADAFSGKLLENTTVKFLSENPPLAAKIWPERPDWQNAITCPVYWIPSYRQEYCSRNQKLYKILANELHEDCPLFAANPEEKRQLYIKLSNNSITPNNCHPWIYQLRLFASLTWNFKQKSPLYANVLNFFQNYKWIVCTLSILIVITVVSVKIKKSHKAKS